MIGERRQPGAGGRFLADFLLEPIEPASVARIVGLVAAGVLLMVGLGWAGVIDLGFMGRQFGSLLAPAVLTIEITVASYVLGLAIGMPLGLLRGFFPSVRRAGRERPSGKRSVLRLASWPLYGAGTGYVEGLRGTPFYVQMWVAFFLVAALFPTTRFAELWAGLLALTLNTGAYQSEIFRAGFQSVGQGQVEAAKSIGMGSGRTFLHIVLPQSVRLIILPLTNEFVSLLKASSILSIIAVAELTHRSRDLANTLGHPVEAFIMISIVYLAIIIPTSRALARIERTRRIPGLGVAEPVRAALAAAH